MHTGVNSHLQGTGQPCKPAQQHDTVPVCTASRHPSQAVACGTLTCEPLPLARGEPMLEVGLGGGTGPTWLPSSASSSVTRARMSSTMALGLGT